MVETSKTGCCIIKEKAKPQKSWSFSSHKCVLCICIFIQTLQYVLCASGTSSWAYPSCTDLCCINNSLALSPANLNLLVFSSYLYLLCHMPLNLTAVVLPLLSRLWDFLSEGWVLNFLGDGRRAKGVLFLILVLSFHPQNSSHIFFFPAVSLLLRCLRGIFVFG